MKMTYREFEVLQEYGRSAYEVVQYRTGVDAPRWEDLPRVTQRAWAMAADAVLVAYDPEWPSRKAGM